MNILWTTCGVIGTLHGRPYSDFASARYRLIAPATGLIKHGINSNVIRISQDSQPEDIPDLENYDVLVVSKTETELDLEVVRRAKERGIITLLDVCDNHFESEKHGHRFIALAEMVDQVVASTPKMAEIIKQHTGRDALVVNDAVEGMKQWPVFQPTDTYKLMWYGHKSNITSLTDFVPELIPLSDEIPIELNIVTAGLPEIEQDLEKWKSVLGERFRVRYSAWAFDKMPQYFRECDAVIIPSSKNDRKSVKSPNRLFEAVWAGKFTVAHPIPSYEAFSPYTWVGENLVEGLKWGLAHSNEVPVALHEGQTYIEKHFSLDEITLQWKSAFEHAKAKRLMAEANKLDAEIRLNLGCGDKILDGYINVDVAESRKGMRPDILADLKDLSFLEDNSVDEILSVHVIEHFWRWEVDSVLQEWIRVLKPGARLVLECPNLRSACEEFLSDPDTKAGPGQEGQRTMWVFYGDPQWQDPLMVHRWGYTPNSLATVMAQCGLVNLRQEPAQFKLREPRDMRIVGEKAHAA
jgi:hypothetical protein